MKIELPTDLKEIPTKLETFTSTISSLISQVAELENIQREIPAELQALPVLVSSVRKQLKTLDSLPSLLNKVTETLNRFANVVENALEATTKDVPSASQATALPAEGEKNTKDAETNLKDELVDLLGTNVVTRYYNKKLIFDKYCDKMLKRKKSPTITNCELLTKKGPSTLKIYREDGSEEVISNLKFESLKFLQRQLFRSLEDWEVSSLQYMQRKPKGQWTADERKAANLDQRLNSLIMSVLPDDQMNYVINCLTAKSTWDDLILYHEGPSDVKESRVMDLKLCYNTFKFKEDSIYETEKNKSLVSATPLSTAFFSTFVVQDFQNSPDDEEDTRSSHEYLNDLEEEYQARALLAKSKRFFKKGTQRFSSAKSTDQTECHKCGKKDHFARDCWSKTSVPSYQSPFQSRSLSSPQHKPELRPTKDFEAKYNKVKAKLALLSSSASASKAATVKNKGL
ncbi:retrovirus-related pol polyprotein from transposon TNT 1-94, partial [Tanacetum coccineum]